ncbi:hypothetical protein Xsto_04123 [Xenorhabdus stockiae]|uniref:DUF7823 domain-containing protein n=1 Tax=Xenorhabdus stockiae TaxID=351614 RepID=A0A2D0K4R2_9GAMM|nr:hypothetical protein [Xenorhabdus stockiae]PHM57046.1 hypothetical protein Xsto_04123 [Xenorhabdus stockiae]
MSDVNKPACPEGAMLSFDLNIGTIQFYNGGNPDYDKVQEWGYSASSIGTLTNLQSTMGVGNILAFQLIEVPIGTFWGLQLEVDTQNQPYLGSKKLEIMANGSTYNLGVVSPHVPYLETYFLYISNGAKQLGDFLKQNVGNTTPIHFCFNWK